MLFLALILLVVPSAGRWRAEGVSDIHTAFRAEPQDDAPSQPPPDPPRDARPDAPPDTHTGGAKIQPAPEKPPKPDPRPAIEWLRNSRWYEVNVGTFAPGEEAQTADAAGTAERALRAVGERLGYIKELGFNVVVLTGWTPSQARLLATAGEGGSSNAHTTPNDSQHAAPNENNSSAPTNSVSRALRELVDAAHHVELRVVLSLDAALADDTSRLPVVDGWRIISAAAPAGDAIRNAAHAIRRTDSQAAIIADGDGDAPAAAAGVADAIESSRLAPVIGAFVMSDKSVSADAVLDAIRRAGDAASAGGVRRIDVLCGDDRARLMSALSSRHVEGREAHASRALEVAAWRLTVMAHTLAVEMPLMRAGEEVGMTGDRASLERTRVWAGAGSGENRTMDPGFRADFRSVTRLANALHAAHEPLRGGAFRKVLADDDQRVFAFGRMLGRREVIVVVNASTDRQRVEFQVGSCEEGMVGVIRPELEPALSAAQHAKLDPLQPVTTEPRLRFAGNRAMVDARGLVAINLDPLSLKIVIAQEASGE